MKNKIDMRHSWVEKVEYDNDGNTVITIDGVRNSDKQQRVRTILRLSEHASRTMIAAIAESEWKRKHDAERRHSRVKEAVADAWRKMGGNA